MNGELTRETTDLPPPPLHLSAGVNDDAPGRRPGPACLSISCSPAADTCVFGYRRSINASVHHTQAAAAATAIISSITSISSSGGGGGAGSIFTLVADVNEAKRSSVFG